MSALKKLNVLTKQIVMGWVHDELILRDTQQAASNEMTDALDDVLARRKKQDAKWGEQNHNPYIYLAILIEEVGELGQAILQTQFGGDKGGWLNVRNEAVDVAAVGLALIECLDRDKWTVGDMEFNNP
jgi:NTP pyrophosphatase (non-canonical NTP hydrolase)